MEIMYYVCMSEPPKNPPPILEYATPERWVPGRLPRYLVVMLYGLAGLGVLLGGIQCLFGMSAVAIWEIRSIVVGGVLLLLGLGLMGLGVWMIFQIQPPLRVAALRRAVVLMIVGEVYAWAWVC
ncbi:MAG: hypothetical protein FWD53_12275, partial [Phycisphaerales bacterium]|nr:hypothetical protein [Phycisphaerales bacterium]